MFVIVYCTYVRIEFYPFVCQIISLLCIRELTSEHSSKACVRVLVLRGGVGEVRDVGGIGRHCSIQKAFHAALSHTSHR